MPGRKSAAETGDKRNVVNVPLNPQANFVVNQWCDRTGGSKTRLVQRILEWFAGAPESMQSLIVSGRPAADVREYVLQNALAYLESASDVTPVAAEGSRTERKTRTRPEDVKVGREKSNETNTKRAAG
jgi:hypothetical protein